MGDDSEIQAKGIGGIDLEDGYFNNVMFVPDLVLLGILHLPWTEAIPLV